MKSVCTFLTIIALAAAGDHLHAQVCNNETVQFRETFGAGTAAPLAPGRTNYSYLAGGSLSDGDYRLFNNAQAKPEWHTSADHTGDLNGRMMVVNASYTAGEFYRDTVYNLTQVATYSVYFHAMNVNTVGTCSPNPILPRLQLIVESYNADGTFTQLGSIVSNDIAQAPTPTWIRVSGYFNLPAGVSAIRYRILNNSTGGCGNDLAIDDITFSQCAPIMLPVSGFSLKASAQNSTVILNWSTYQEINTDRFVVEKSAEGRNWKPVTAIKAAGESHSRLDYDVKDNNSLSPACYYRIAAIDTDGKTMYSNAVTIRSAATGRSTAYPNPFMGTVGIELSVAENTRGALRLFNINGKMIKSASWQLKPGINVTTLDDLRDLGAGVYFLDVVDSNGKMLYRTKLLKQS